MKGRPYKVNGKRFGRLVVLGSMKKPGEPSKCHCLCDCGNTIVVERHQLVRGRTKSCGCLRRELASIMGLKRRAERKVEPPVGQKFGRLTVLSDFEHPDKPAIRHVLCRCDCGAEVAVRLHEMRKGKIKSCGCLRQEQAGRLHTYHKRSRPMLMYEGEPLVSYAERHDLSIASLHYHIRKGRTVEEAVAYLTKKKESRNALCSPSCQ